VSGVTEFPWPAGAATGVGSLPGTDIRQALALVLDELPELPHLPELPARGPGAEMIGRSAGLLVDLPFELYAGQWRVASSPGTDARRTADLWQRDLDELAHAAAEFDGVFKVQSAGPWTLAASLDLPIGGRLLRDSGAVRDLAASLAEGLAVHVAEVSARLPRATLLLQLDEPSLPAVLAGQIPSESGFSAYRPVDAGPAADLIRAVIDKAAAPIIVHCCAADVPISVLRQAGAIAVGLDLSLLKELDPLGEALDAGLGLFAGVAGLNSAAVAGRVRDLWQRLGFPLAQLPGQVVVTPACGLADEPPAQARDAMRASRDAARRLADEALS
jgi:hypothetical protein